MPLGSKAKLEFLKSRSVAAYVVKQLKLADDNDFLQPDAGRIGKLLARLGWDSSLPETEDARVGAAMGAVSDGLDIRRIGDSDPIKIDVQAAQSGASCQNRERDDRRIYI